MARTMTKAQAKKRMMEANDKIGRVWLANRDSKNPFYSPSDVKKMVQVMNLMDSLINKIW